MEYNVIGLMSGSSLDGLDIAFVRLTEEGGKWSYEWLATDCKPYPEEWLQKLKTAQSLTVPQLLRLHTEYGHFIGRSINAFLKEHANAHEADFIVSHGHTILHEPANGVTYQLCDGASIAAETGISVISDLRNMDVALGGQGAPIVPIADRLLFSDYDYLLNLGGIANISIQRLGLAFDICPCNQLLNHYALKAGYDYDDKGALARQGRVEQALQGQLSTHLFYQQSPPKSLSNEFSKEEILPLIDASGFTPEDALANCTAHIIEAIATATKPHTQPSHPTRLLVTGGGAFNVFLIEQLAEALKPFGIETVVPAESLIQYKEALAMALIGALRWRGEVNVLASVTGAKNDSIGGAIWAGSKQR
jgi:anhydro-N-acetylmuramic acid kinase